MPAMFAIGDTVIGNPILLERPGPDSDGCTPPRAARAAVSEQALG